MRFRQQSCRNGRYVFGPPRSKTLWRSVFPRVSTDRFWFTMASASEHMISTDGIEDFTRLTMSVSANTPHFAATWCSLLSSKRSFMASSDGMPTLMKHLSMVAPVPDAHLSFIDAMAVLFRFFEAVALISTPDPRSHARRIIK